MSAGVKKELTEYVEFLKIVEKRLASHSQILTFSKSKVLEILFDSGKHLTVEEILNISRKSLNNQLKTTTIYRTLSTFESLGIVDSIIVDEKKRYEVSYFKQPHYHLYCQECNEIEEFENLEIHNMFLEQLNQREFKATGFNVIINGICKKCLHK